MAAINLTFESFGEVASQPLIILHGFMASSRNWRTVAKKLAESHRVYVVDMRNHGASPHAAEMDYPIMALDILQFMDNIGLKRTSLLGHSMGGKVAMWFAMHFPECVHDLIVVDIAPVTYNHSFDSIIQALKQLPLGLLTNRKQAENYLAEAIPDLSYRQFLLQNLLLKDGVYYWRINLDIIQRNAHHIVGFPESSPYKYENPALFIAGEHSTYITTDDVLHRFPYAEITEISGTGHWLYVEEPEAFCLLVVDWLMTVRSNI